MPMGDYGPLSNEENRMKITTFPLMKEFPLKCDESGEAYVKVRQAREGENAERDDMFSTITRVFEVPEIDGVQVDGNVKLETSQNPTKTRRKEAYLTLASIRGITDEAGNELFRHSGTVDGDMVRGAMSESEFNRVWNRLPPDAVSEIMGYVYELNPTWDPDRRGE